MDLFDYSAKKRLENSSPLANRLRPSALEGFYGHESVVGKGTLLRRAIETDKLSSAIFFGPPGTGKTTLARIIANMTQSVFISINASVSGAKDLKDAVAGAKDSLARLGARTIVFIDEIHRFNKSQQDILLPAVEEGAIILIGATTENPYFEVNKALVSRSVIYRLDPLETSDVKKILIRAASAENINIEETALDFLADASDGDARKALNALEIAALSSSEKKIDLNAARESIQKRAINYDKNSDYHYDIISAFIKSMRGSDPDAAVYYLARALYGGEDPKFLARRILICASEDVGNADPHALLVAEAASRAAEFIGMPECRINLAQAAIYVACAPKSNAVICAIDAALEDADKIKISGVPLWLRDSHTDLYKDYKYKYAHDYPGNYVAQQYLPDELKNKKYYFPTENGVEKKIKERLKNLEP
jgi:putative ATPase